MCDVPCSGTGVLARNPDIKAKLQEKDIAELQQKQRDIVDQAVRHLKPGGRLVYTTCSLLNQENMDQVMYICDTHGLSLETELFQTLPDKRGMDGLFGARLRKQE